MALKYVIENYCYFLGVHMRHCRGYASAIMAVEFKFTKSYGLHPSHEVTVCTPLSKYLYVANIYSKVKRRSSNYRLIMESCRRNY